MNINKIFQSKIFSGALMGIGALAVVGLIFQAGVWVGYRKAAFSFRWGDNYYSTIAGPRGRFAPGLPHGDFPEAHGSVGRIVRVELPTFVIQDQDGTEKVVLVGNDTVIRRFRDNITADQLKVDDTAAVIGSPNDQSQIEAKLIRLMPPSPMGGPRFR